MNSNQNNQHYNQYPLIQQNRQYFPQGVQYLQQFQNNDYSSQQNPLIDQGLQYTPQGVQYLLQHYQQYYGRQSESQNYGTHQQMQMMQMQQVSHPAAQNAIGYQDDLNLDEFGVPRPMAAPTPPSMTTYPQGYCNFAGSTPPTVPQSTVGQYGVQLTISNDVPSTLKPMDLPSQPLTLSRGGSVSPDTVEQAGSIEVKLKNEEICKKFDDTDGGNEMLVTITGRDIFPRLEFLLKNLPTFGCYVIGIKLRRINKVIMKHQKTKGWYESKESADNIDLESNELQSNVKTGGDLMKEGASFAHVKIYNIPKLVKKEEAAPRKRKPNGESLYPERRKKVDLTLALLVSTQCIYMPIVTVYEVQPCGGPMKKLSEFNFPVAKFHVTTEYKNPEICKLKILENNHVRGDTKRKLTEEPKKSPKKRKTAKSKNSEDSGLSRTLSSDSGTSSMGSVSPGLPPVSTILSGNRMVSTSSSEEGPRSTVGSYKAQIDKIDEMP